MKFKKLIILGISLIFANTTHAKVLKYTYQPEKNSNKRVYAIARVNHGPNIQTQYVGNLIKQKRIVFRIVNDDPNIPFSRYQFSKNDVVIYNTEEINTFKVGEDKSKKAYQRESRYFKANSPIVYEDKTLVPCLIISALDNKKVFAYCDNKSIENNSKFTLDENYNQLTSEELLNYEPEFSNLTLVYIILPKDRLGTGYLQIKQNGNWITSEGKVFQMPILGLSRISLKDNKNDRMNPDSHTPQGIYRLEGVIKNDENLQLGDKPYLNIDSGTLPVNASSYNENSFILEQILPQNSWNDYWVNEYPLAHSITGRQYLRIHGNSKDPKFPPTYDTPNTHITYRPTRGCLNVGETMEELLNILVDIEAVSLDYQRGFKYPSGKDRKWNISQNYGKVFIVVKDSEENTKFVEKIKETPSTKTDLEKVEVETEKKVKKDSQNGKS